MLVKLRTDGRGSSLASNRQVWREPTFKHTARGGCNPMAAYIGVDVSKHVLDAQMGAHYFQVENTAKGLKKCSRALEKFIQSGNPVSTVVCEASGGYERD